MREQAEEQRWLFYGIWWEDLVPADPSTATDLAFDPH